MGLLDCRYLARAAVCVALLVVMPHATAEEKIPKLGGPDSGKPLPDAAALDALEKSYGSKREGHMDYVNRCLQSLAERGGNGASSFGRAMAIQCGAFPECGLRFNAGVFALVPRLFRSGHAPAREQLDKALVIAMLLERRTNQNDTVLLGAAYGRLADAWGRLLMNQPMDGVGVRAAAETVVAFEDKHAIPGDPWREFLTAMARSKDPSISEWTRTEIARVAKAHPNDITYRRLRIIGDITQAVTLSQYEPKEAKPLLKSLLEALRPGGSQEVDGEALAGAYNQAVTASRRIGLRTKATYRTRTVRSSKGHVLFELPIGTGWRSNKVDGDQEDGEWIKPIQNGGEIVLRIWRYSTSTDYEDSYGKVIGGDNVGARAKAFFESAKAEMRKVKKVKAKLRSPSRALRKTRGFEVFGAVEDGETLRIREWYFKTENVRGWMMNVCARETAVAGQESEDPELKHALSTLREWSEAERKRKK